MLGGKDTTNDDNSKNTQVVVSEKTKSDIKKMGRRHTMTALEKQVNIKNKLSILAIYKRTSNRVD